MRFREKLLIELRDLIISKGCKRISEGKYCISRFNDIQDIVSGIKSLLIQKEEVNQLCVTTKDMGDIEGVFINAAITFGDTDRLAVYNVTVIKEF